ncbi:MAG: YeeE/YedE family protein [Bacteroidia bacterium]
MELNSSAFILDQLLYQPWHWSVAGIAIAFTLFGLTWLGKSLGISASFDSWCKIAGADKRFSFFNRDLKADRWRILFVIGVTLGGGFSANFLGSKRPVQISGATTQHLTTWGITVPQTIAEGTGFIPEDLFNWSNPLGIFMAIAGGFLVGFGARYARGCTSGHAITGLSHLQLQSLLTVIGFFIGGLIMTWGILPHLFS